MIKNCKHCNAEFKPTRWDKKYCSDKCKNTYNNRTKSEAYHITKAINKILWRNRMILRSFQEQGQAYLNQLKRAGFDFSYMTHQYKSDEENPVYFYYDFGLQPINSNIFKIIYHDNISIDESY